MKRPFLKLSLAFLILFLYSTSLIFSQQLLEGQNYKIVVPSINPSGDFLTDEDEEYEILGMLGQTFADPRAYSDLYEIGPNNLLFEPNVPEVACFETNSDGSSECTTGPNFLNVNGMTRVCGPNGCYDRGRFEINPQDNPEETLYGIIVETSSPWEIVETSSPWECGDDITDTRDQQTYTTVQIGTQCWMAKNLNYDTANSYCYNDLTPNCDTYGRLYTWAAAMDGDTEEGSQGICPDGWHLPSDAEHTLDSYLSTGTCDPNRSAAWDCNPAGAKLAGEFDLWEDDDLRNHANFGDSGFEALPGGFQFFGYFDSLGASAYFWSSSPSGGNALIRSLHSSVAGVLRIAYDQAYGFSVRCVRNPEIKYYIDGTTYMIKDEPVTIYDYKTKADWESEVFNIKGLEPNTEYSLKITALFGDLSESVPSEPKLATTSIGALEFKVGAGYEDGEDINYNHPLEIHFDESFGLIRGARVTTSDRLIWTLINSNANTGITVVQKGLHGGLYNAAGEGYTIESTTTNLDLGLEGVGINNHSMSQLYNEAGGEGLLSALTVEGIYDGEGNNVGIIDTVFKKIYQSSGPIHTGQTSLNIKARASLTTPNGNYTEDITFVLVAKY